MTTPKQGRPFHILAWPRRSPTNVYTGALNDALEAKPGVRVSSLDVRRRMLVDAFLRRYDIVHVHWLERPFWPARKRELLRQVSYVLAVSLILRLRRTRFVWTAHDPQPHDSPMNAALTSGWTRWLWALYRPLMTSLVDGVLLLSESHRGLVIARAPNLRRKPMAVVHHPHFRGQYPDSIGREAARVKLGIPPHARVAAFVGSLKAYKNPDGLIRAFAALQEDAVLLVAGAAETTDYAGVLASLAARDPRIRLSCEFVPDSELQIWLRAADLAVLPYRRVTNSGSAHLALSFDLPVLVPDEPVFRELEALVGPEWVRRFSGDLDADDLSAALGWAKRPSPSKPDLSALDWDEIVGRTLAFLRRVAGRSSPEEGRAD